MPIEKITIFCFAASYAVALLLELAETIRAKPFLRIIAIIAGMAGLLAHTLFLGGQRLALASRVGPLLFLAWVLAVFYLYGTVHHRKRAWGVYVLPVVLLLVALGAWQTWDIATTGEGVGLGSDDFWRTLHVGVFVLASVGLSVSFVASVMYLVQARRLRQKILPGSRPSLLSQERLETMNRRALTLGFMLLTLGMLVGLTRLTGKNENQLGLGDPRVLLTSLLWFVSTLVLAMRYAFHLRGRRMAIISIVVFALLLIVLVTAHGGAT